VTATETNTSDAIARLRPAVEIIDDRLASWRILARNARLIPLTGETDMRALGTLLHEPAAAYPIYDHFEPTTCSAVQTMAMGGSPTAATAAAATMRASGPPSAPRRIIRQPPDDQRLTQHQQDALNLLSQGLSNAAIAAALALTEKTTKNHLNRRFTTLGVHSRLQAVRLLASSKEERCPA
jgi:DNA-binding NarL/FixJ family response regulator